MGETLKALIFDLDGLVVDTETPDFKTWQDVYARYGQELPLSQWVQIVGGTGESDFDPHTYLEELTGKSLDREDIWISRRRQYVELIEETECLPGVCALIDAAEQVGLKMAVASSSPCSWVTGHLTRLGIYDRFHAIVTADDVEKTKPDPALFNLAAKELGVENRNAVVFEDSYNGVLAANRAGIFVVAVPNEITKYSDLSGANLTVLSLEDLTIADLGQHLAKA